VAGICGGPVTDPWYYEIKGATGTWSLFQRCLHAWKRRDTHWPIIDRVSGGPGIAGRSLWCPELVTRNWSLAREWTNACSSYGPAKVRKST
jgi:hypothetical protein